MSIVADVRGTTSSELPPFDGTARLPGGEGCTFELGPGRDETRHKAGSATHNWWRHEPPETKLDYLGGIRMPASMRIDSALM